MVSQGRNVGHEREGKGPTKEREKGAGHVRGVPEVEMRSIKVRLS